MNRGLQRGIGLEAFSRVAKKLFVGPDDGLFTTNPGIEMDGQGTGSLYVYNTPFGAGYIGTEGAGTRSMIDLRSSQGTIYSPTNSLSGDELGGLQIGGGSSTAGTLIDVGTFTLFAQADFGASSAPSIWKIRAVPVGSTAKHFVWSIDGNGAVTHSPDGQTFTDGAIHSHLSLTSTVNYTTSGSWANQFVNYAPTIACTASGNAFAGDTVFNNAANYNATGASVNFGAILSFISQYTKTIDTQTGRSINANSCFLSQPLYNAISNGAYTLGSHTGFSANASFTNTGFSSNACTAASDTGFTYGLTVGTNTTVTTAKGFNVSNPTNNGTLTTLVGVDIAQLTAGTTNIGFRSAGSMVYTPTVCTVTTNAATVPVTISHAKVTNSSAATCTITIATTNAVDGQELLVRYFDSSAVSQTVTFTNSETGKAGAPPASLGSTTIPSTYRFIFNSGTSKWTYTGN